jgi:hypothetical protein
MSRHLLSHVAILINSVLDEGEIAYALNGRLNKCIGLLATVEICICKQIGLAIHLTTHFYYESRRDPDTAFFVRAPFTRTSL